MDYPDYRLVCTWGARSQTAQEIACDVQRFSSRLLLACPQLGAWHYLGAKDKLTPLPEDVGGVCAQVLEPGNSERRGAAPDMVLPVGFSALLYTSKSNGAAWMAHVGKGTDWARNRVAVNLPRKGSLAQALTDPQMMDRLFRVMIEVWQPDWATVSHTDMSDPEPEAPVHWMLYGRQPLSPGQVLPDGVLVHHLIGDAGELIAPGQYFVTTPGERFVYGNLAHREVCDQLKRVLRQSGWLPPVQAH
jgi:hypothetical protein